MRLPRFRAPAPATLGGVTCVAGFALLASPSLFAAALGLELVATAFWIWARAAEDRATQLPRWMWLRRPASAMWLAAALHRLVGVAPLGAFVATRGAASMAQWLEAIAVVWAGLELLAALPLARPFSDRPGPLLATGAWLPVILPSAGFILLWRHAAHWTTVPEVRSAAAFLLLVTAWLATLRAYSRRQWAVSLRWMTISDSALGAVLVAVHAVPSDAALLLWLAACGGRSVLLAGELRGAAPRRGATPHRMWRLSLVVSLAALSWPVLARLGFGPRGVANGFLAIAAGLAIGLEAWVTVNRLVEAPERRAMVRREAALPLTQVAAIVTLIAGPIALLVAWWNGFEPGLRTSLAALSPVIVGGGIAWWRGERTLEKLQPAASMAGAASRRAAGAAFQAVVTIERGAVSGLSWLGRALMAPARDVHTGDAQEYLLFLVGLSVLALVLPLLQ